MSGESNFQTPRKNGRDESDLANDLSTLLLAGHAVLIAPVSREIPCEQGILQGIPRFSEISRDEVSLSPCCDARFLKQFPARVNREIISSNRESRCFAGICSGVWRAVRVQSYVLKRCSLLEGEVQRPGMFSERPTLLDDERSRTGPCNRPLGDRRDACRQSRSRLKYPKPISRI
jgi:hypothetical protein